MPLCVLNPKGRDPVQDLSRGPGVPGDPGHPPVNFHAYAACTGGSFEIDARRAVETGNPVLVLVRRKLHRTLAAVRACKAAGRRTIVSWKETGLVQVEDQLASARAWRLFREIVATADGCLSATEELLPVYRAAASTRPVAFLPTPYPLEFETWNFARPLDECQGIFLGTRRFKHRVRCHQLALSQAAWLARETGCRVTVINPEGARAEARIRAIGIPEDRLEIHGPLSYPEFLRLMSRHRLVLQRDLSAVPGQVAGDALLCRIPCLGGNGTIDRLGFPGWCAGEVTGDRLQEIARELLTDETVWLEERERIAARAGERLSYRAIAPQLEAFLSDPASYSAATSTSLFSRSRSSSACP